MIAEFNLPKINRAWYDGHREQVLRGGDGLGDKNPEVTTPLPEPSSLRRRLD